MDTETNTLSSPNPLFLLTGAVFGSYVEDYLLINGTNMPYGFVKYQDLTMTSFALVQASDGSMTFTKYGAKILTGLTSYFIDQANNCLIWGNGTSIMNSTLNIVTSPIDPFPIMAIAFLDKVIYQGNHTSFKFINN